ncbi:DUF357 domain-containing protein [Candidatus Woesearchaeota archaeon]|nr:DUF357 domain-containing protein [Candidatus Woesearchaeota archaeon]
MVREDRLQKYFSITSKALKKIKIIDENFEINSKKTAEDFLDMAQRYFDDARHFYEKGDKDTAFAALNYAHGWLDAGVRLGIFDVDNDDQLFVLK